MLRLKYRISLVMAENEVKIWPGGSRNPHKMNFGFIFSRWLYIIHYERTFIFTYVFLPPTPWITQTIRFGSLSILRVPDQLSTDWQLEAVYIHEDLLHLLLID